MIFLSYSHKDTGLVASIAEALRSEFGNDGVFFDQWSIQPGDSIIDRMEDGLDKCSIFFFLVSKNSLSSQMVGLEWKNALLKHIKGNVTFIPVKLDDCDMPNILLQNLYINLYGNGMDLALRQMIDVGRGTNTYRPGEVEGYQNIRAYVSGTNGEMTVEFRAEAYVEPHSKFMMLVDNLEDEVSCSPNASGLFETGFQKDVTLSNGNVHNGILIGSTAPTSPGFPFVVKLSATGDNKVLLRYAMRANAADSYIVIPMIGDPSLFSPK